MYEPTPHLMKRGSGGTNDGEYNGCRIGETWNKRRVRGGAWSVLPNAGNNALCLHFFDLWSSNTFMPLDTIEVYVEQDDGHDLEIPSRDSFRESQVSGKSGGQPWGW
jgi:hypothetical protein